jgi:putative transposase
MSKKRREPPGGGRRCPKRGRRYSKTQKRKVVAWATKHGVAAAVSKFGVSDPAVRRWLAQHAKDVKAGTAKPPRKVPAKGRRTEATKATSTSTTAAPGGPSATKPTGGAVRAQHTPAERARHGRRYSVAEKLAVLEAAAVDGVTAAAEKFGPSRWSIYDWQRRKQTAATEKEADLALAPRSSCPKHNARRLSEERYHLIAETWKKNQALGPRQVRNQLRRNHGLRVGTSTARKVMEEHGYVPPKVTVERRSVSRYEAVRPHQQVHLDFLHFFVHKAKAYLLLIEDDYSRFLTGWALCEGEQAQPVIEAVDEAIARHGKPEQMVVDGGSGFFSWRGQSQLERVCGDYGIDFIKASKKGSNSKLEALNANVRKELLSRIEFADLADARQQIARWVYTYNFERVHEGLGGLLVPADRFFGRSQEVLAQLERGEPVVVPGQALLDERALELFRVVSRSGRPELWLLGDRIWPPAQS